VISGNTSMGVQILGNGNPSNDTSRNNSIQGNIIGLGSDGRTMFQTPNLNRRGFNRARLIFLQPIGVGIQDASGNIIGGTAAVSRNVIAGNEQAGVYILGHPPATLVAQGNS